MERKVDTLAVMDRPETQAVQGGVSSHPGLTVQSIKDRNPENKGQSVRKIRRLDCESSDLKAATAATTPVVYSRSLDSFD